MSRCQPARCLTSRGVNLLTTKCSINSRNLVIAEGHYTPLIGEAWLEYDKE